LFSPDEQKVPHHSFDDEVSFLKTHFPQGEAYVFGPRSCDHHYFFIYQNDMKSPFSHLPPSTDPLAQTSWAFVNSHQSLEILMTGMDRKVMQQFYRSKHFVSNEETTRTTGIRSLFEGILDAHQFDPLGYSLNGLDDQIYYTIHVTPQPECSFVSFETNLVIKDYPSLVKRVLDCFKPECFTVLVIRDGSVDEIGYTYDGYYQRNHAHHNFNGSRNHLSFFSFREHGTVTPKHRPVVVPQKG